ncbi:MAG: GNAT family N-acetyltransferase, partial [Gelidibacter sp.]|nr:GNAT family N-acetyltransferase [Gelidibacter sp.]
VFDPDYYKFSIGKTSIIKLLEWCFENKYRISDFSKGDFDYKHKWGNVAYDFHYHIFYDKSSLKSRCTASFVALFFNAKLYLRKRNINSIYRKYMYWLKGKPTGTLGDYTIEKLTDFQSTSDLEAIDYK